MAKEQLSPALSERMEREKKTHSHTDFSFPDEAAIRRFPTAKPDTVWRPAFAKDIDKILYSPYYNRYTDKTQVFSLTKTTTSPAAVFTCSWCPVSPAPSAVR